MPKGTGEVNPKGIEFYNKLIDELIANGIEPIITLYHWDLPAELHYKGGWLNPDIADWFEAYVKVAAENFTDRVKKIITVNEPLCVIGHGYADGDHAPGLKLTEREYLSAAHNLLIAHGKAVRALKKYGAEDLRIGIAPNFASYYPKDENNDTDIEAARQKMFGMDPGDPRAWIAKANWWLDPIIKGCYPEEGRGICEPYLPEGFGDEIKQAMGGLDFICFNLYHGTPVTAGSDGKPELVGFKPGYPRSNIGWPVTPDAIKWAAKYLYERYNMPIIISENGMSCHDSVSLDGKVHDPNRIDYYNRYLLKVEEAIDEGTDIIGYFAWSFMDNFEWARGYRERFGLIYVDYETQERIIKDSGYWYSEVIKTNGESLHN